MENTINLSFRTNPSSSPESTTPTPPIIESKPPFREIGHGNCGSVWAVDRPDSSIASWALKLEDMNPHRDIRHEALMHCRIEEAAQTLRHSGHKDKDKVKRELIEGICIPQFARLVERQDVGWWRERLARLPRERRKCNALVSERILPFGRGVREEIVERFCPKRFCDAIKSSEKDEDCLLRCYLGRWESHRSSSSSSSSRRSMFSSFTLRNYPLTLRQMLELGCPVEEYVKIMADTLAFLHWGANIDAHDVEFVLAPPSNHLYTHSGRIFHNEVLGPHCLWILDFDCVRPVGVEGDGDGDGDGEGEGVERMVRLHYVNDPYYPRPGTGNEEMERLWDVFRERYLDASQKILGEGSGLPEEMVRRLKARGLEIAGRKRLVYGLEKDDTKHGEGD